MSWRISTNSRGSRGERIIKPPPVRGSIYNNVMSMSPHNESKIPAAAEPNLSNPADRARRQRELSEEVQTNPTNLEAFVELARLYRSENRPVEAARILRQALEVFPEHPSLQHQLEEAVLARSLQQFREVSDLASRLNTPESDRELAKATKDWAARRIEVCQARLKRDPSTHQLRIQLAEAHCDASHFDDAIEILTPLVDQDEFAASANLIIGRCHLAKGERLEAMRALRACAMRRSVSAAPPIRRLALRLLCETAETLELNETLANYRAALASLEQQIDGAAQANRSGV